METDGELLCLIRRLAGTDVLAFMHTDKRDKRERSGTAGGMAGRAGGGAGSDA